MSLTGEALLTAFSIWIDDYFQSTTTSVGNAAATTLVDTTLEREGTEGTVDGFVRFTAGTANNVNLVRRVSSYSSDTITVAPAWAAATGSGDTYQYHRYEPTKKFRALDRARMLAFPQLARLHVDESLTADGFNNEFDLADVATTIRKGPFEVWLESPMAPQNSWNLITTNAALNGNTGWTSSSVTSSQYVRSNSDYVVPKFETSCVKLVGSGTFSQNMGSAIAAQVAGRNTAFGVWVYSRVAGAYVYITDSAGTSTSTSGQSSYHMGKGWQFLEIDRIVASGNSSFTVGINTGSNITVYAERAYLALMKGLPLSYSTLLVRKGIVRDGSIQELWFNRPPPRGYQMRLVGRDPLSALGTDATTQTTNTMELDELNAELLYAYAARILFTWEGWSAGNSQQIQTRINDVMERFKEQQEDSRMRYPTNQYLDII